MWRAMGRRGEMWGDTGSRGELWGDIGSRGEMWGAVESRWEAWVQTRARCACSALYPGLFSLSLSVLPHLPHRLKKGRTRGSGRTVSWLEIGA